MSDIKRFGTDTTTPGESLLGGGGLLLGGGGTLDARMLQQPGMPTGHASDPTGKLLGDTITPHTRNAVAGVAAADDRQRIADELDGMPSYQISQVREFEYVYGTSYDSFTRVRDIVVRLMSQRDKYTINPFGLLHNTLRFYPRTPQIFSVLTEIFSYEPKKPHAVFFALNELSGVITGEVDAAHIIQTLLNTVYHIVAICKLSNSRSARYLEIFLALCRGHRGRDGFQSRISSLQDWMSSLHAVCGESGVETMYEFRFLYVSERDFSYVVYCIKSVFDSAGDVGLARLCNLRATVHDIHEFTSLVQSISSSVSAGTP